MKKYFLTAAAAISLLACQKNEKADALVTNETEVVDNSAEIPAEKSAEELAAEAQSKPLTTVALSSNHHDFGKIGKAQSVTHDYELTNTGDKPLIISAVKPACGCTAPEYTKEPIMPGQKGKVTLAFDPTNFDGAVQKTAEVFTNTEKSPITLSFSADVQP